jgi:sugar fermentation stimulation protein A
MQASFILEESQAGMSRYNPISAPLFETVHWGKFLTRPNRFLVECSLNGRNVRAHLPNPGRLWELLLPGQPIGLIDNTDAPERKTLFTAVAVEKEGRTILLHTHKANMIVKGLIEQGKVAGLEGARVVQTEVARGNSRFDLLVQKGLDTILIEVKSCTLFGRNVAMFPDAVTARGRKHLLELALHADGGMKCEVVFLVQTSDVRFFLPDYHTDYEFARTFAALKDRLRYRAIAVTWDSELRLSPHVRELVIPWDTLEKESRDRGSYLIVYNRYGDAIGKVADTKTFHQGYYIKACRADNDLSVQMLRDLRRIRKEEKERNPRDGNMAADRCTALPIRSAASIHSELCRRLEQICDWPVPAASRRTDRLYAMAENPFQQPRFIDMLQYFRMDRLRFD